MKNYQLIRDEGMSIGVTGGFYYANTFYVNVVLKDSNKVYIYATSPLWAGCDIRSIFKQSTAGLRQEFSFSQTGCLTKAKEFWLPYYLSITVRKIDSWLS